MPNVAHPRGPAPDSTRRLALCLLLGSLAAAALGLACLHQAWLPPLAVFGIFAAAELALAGVAAVRMVRSADACAQALADTAARRSAIDDLQSHAVALLEETSVKSRELDDAKANLRAATKVNALLALVAQHMPNAVLIADGRGMTLWTNVACEQLCGLAQAESVARPITELLSRAMNEFPPEDARLLVETGQSASIVSKNISPEGKIRWFSVTFQPVRNAEQELVNFIVLVDDFTSFREAHLRQRHSEEIALQVSRLAQIGAWELLLPAREMRWEPELYRICQVELGYLPTVPAMAGFLPGKERAEFLRQLERAIRDGQIFDLECPLLTARGEQRWVQIFGWPEVSAGRTVRLFGTVQDITGRHAAETERRTLEGQLFQLQKMETLGTLAGGIAHDFNNLLTGMIGNQDLALEDLGTDHPARRRLEEARTATILACELVEQILTFSRQTGAERVSTDLGVVIEEASRFLRASVPSTIQIDIQIEPGCGRVMADVPQLNQLLLNLGTNGAHAMRATGGVLSISLATTALSATQAAAHGNLPLGRYVRLSVRDTGHGMDAETQRRIFHPFFTTKPPGEGTGLGLAIVQSIVRAHGGGIDVISSPGVGTSVDVYLPMEESGEWVADTATRAPPPRGSGELICIVDDEQIVSRTAQITLEWLGYRTVVFSSPRDCLAALQGDGEPCALLLTDQTMPDIDGIELTRQVREFAPQLPIIIMSGYFSKITPAALEQLGRVSLLAKPFRSADVAWAVERALKVEAGVVSPPGSG